MTFRFWTDLADGAVMFPVGIAVAALLLLLGQARAAWAWTVAVAGVWAVMLVLKILGYTLDALDPTSPIGAIGLVTPSGHVASATVIYGGLAGLLLAGPFTMARRTATAAIAVAVWIAVTRVLLKEHTLSEVVVGGLVGLVGAIALARSAEMPIERRAVLPIVAVVGVIIVLRHGVHLSWEETIRQVALKTVSGWQHRA